jgi:hypothetical protein
MPADERCGLHHSQCLAPIEPTTETNQSDTGGISGALRFDVTLLIHDKLFAQKKIFGRQGSGGAQPEAEKAYGIDSKREEHSRESFCMVVLSLGILGYSLGLLSLFSGQVSSVTSKGHCMTWGELP